MKIIRKIFYSLSLLFGLSVFGIAAYVVVLAIINFSKYIYRELFSNFELMPLLVVIVSIAIIFAFYALVVSSPDIIKWSWNKLFRKK